MWLALALLDEGLLEKHSMCIAEADSRKGNDRTWCYWGRESLFSGAVPEDSWSHFLQPADDTTAEAIAPYRYFHLRSSDFYAYAKNKLSRSPNVHFVHTSVSDIAEKGDSLQITSDRGTWSSTYAFVSAMPGGLASWKGAVGAFLQNRRARDSTMLWQSFVGWRVRSTKPVFKKERATLMHFDVAQQASTQFIYELPFSENEALVELTRFGREKLNEEEALPLLEEYMSELTDDYVISEWEIGQIPMTSALDMRQKRLRRDARLIFIGTPGGAVKPTTGYAFKRMEQYARRLAKAIKKGQRLPSMYRPWRFRMYDALLLHILANHAQRGREVFLRLFATQPMARILKFLDEETTVFEEILIFSRLPKRLFLRSLTHYLRRA